MKRMVVTLEVSKLSGWLNTHAPCRESKGGHAVWEEGPGGAEGRGGQRRRKQHARGICPKAVGDRARAEHTVNMSSMVVTPEVFQLETSALKFCMPEKSSLMSETAETSQSAMRPYVAVAAAGSTLYAWTATFREAVLVKVKGWGGGGGGHAASQPPSHDASISSSAVRQAPRVRPWQAARGRRRQPLCTSASFSLGGRCCGRGAGGEASA